MPALASESAPKPGPYIAALAGTALTDFEREGVRSLPALETWGRMEAMSVGEDLLEQRRRRRRAGDPRLSDADREILRRITSGNLAPAFQAALDAAVVADPVLGGHDHDD